MRPKRVIVLSHLAATLIAVALVAHDAEWDRPWTPPSVAEVYPFVPQSPAVSNPPWVRPLCEFFGPFHQRPKTGRTLESELYRAAVEALQRESLMGRIFVGRTALPFVGYPSNDRRMAQLPDAIQVQLSRGSRDCSAINTSQLPADVEIRDAFELRDVRMSSDRTGLMFSVPFVSDRDVVVVSLSAGPAGSAQRDLWFRLDSRGSRWDLVRTVVESVGERK